MALDDDEANFFFLAFKKKFLVGCTRHRQILQSIDLLELFAGATMLPLVVIAAWQQRFDGHFWSV